MSHRETSPQKSPHPIIVCLCCFCDVFFYVKATNCHMFSVLYLSSPHVDFWLCRTAPNALEECKIYANVTIFCSKSQNVCWRVDHWCRKLMGFMQKFSGELENWRSSDGKRCQIMIKTQEKVQDKSKFHYKTVKNLKNLQENYHKKVVFPSNWKSLSKEFVLSIISIVR